MSKVAVEALREKFGPRILETDDFRGDDSALVSLQDWHEVALFLREADELCMEQFVDLSAVDYPEREPEVPRFDLVLHVRSHEHNRRLRLKARARDSEEVDSLCRVWKGANWAEREVYDMFGIRFRGHPDLRRILMYDEFVGYPLRKDYPIGQAQPLLPYRTVKGIEKLPPFGKDEGQPWGRIDWEERLEGGDRQVSPALAVQTGQRRALSDSDIWEGKPSDSPSNSSIRPVS